MKKKDLFELYRGLQAVGKLPGAKFAYAVAKNLAAVLAECQIIEKLNEPSDAYKEYSDKRYKLALAYSDTEPDERGVVQVPNDRLEAFNADLAPLNDEYSEAITNRLVQESDFNTLLEEESDIVLFKIKADLLPEGITPEQVTAIMPIIED